MLNPLPAFRKLLSRQYRISRLSYSQWNDGHGNACAIFAEYTFRWPQTIWRKQSEAEAFLRAWQHSYMQAQAEERRQVGI